MENYYELIPEASNLIESQRSVGYTFETAMADIIDNSISALAKNVKVYFDNEEKYVAILDNGYGMTEKELIEAMRYGSKSVYEKRSEHDLGRFGLGMKMASFSQCRKLTVISKKNNIISGAIWDLDIVMNYNSWIIELLEPEEIENIITFNYLEKFKSGTAIIWEKFDKFEQHANFESNFDDALDRAENHLSLVFHRYLQSKELSIEFNDREIEFVDPFFTSNKATQPKSPDVVFEQNRKSKIDIQPYIVPYQNRLTQKEKHILQKFEQNKLNPGLYIYRNRRLIAWGKWFRLLKPNDLANLAKIQIDIPNTMDDLWEIDVKKSQLNIPISLREQLKNIVLKSVGESERVYKFRGTKRNKDNLQYIFDRIEKDNKITYRIDLENPIIIKLQSNLSDEDNTLFLSLIRHIENHLPLESIQYDMASNKEIEINNETDDEIYEEIMTLISNQSTKISKINLLNSLKNNEVYSKHESIILKIQGEVND